MLLIFINVFSNISDDFDVFFLSLNKVFRFSLVCGAVLSVMTTAEKCTQAGIYNSVPTYMSSYPYFFKIFEKTNGTRTTIKVSKLANETVVVKIRAV